MSTLRFQRCFLGLALIFGALMGCSNQTKIVPTSTPLPSIQIKVTPSKSPTTPLLETETLIPLPTFTLTPPPTLGLNESEDAIRQLLKQDEICQFVCIWGITPGRSSWGEAQNVFTRLQLSLFHTQREDKTDSYAADFGFDDQLSGSIQLTVKKGQVDFIRMNIGLANFKGPNIPRKWQAYSPETLLNKYGPPSKVEFFLNYPTEEGFPVGTVWYGMVIYFDAYNLIAEYNQGLSKDENFIKACPLLDKFSGISIWLGENPENPPPSGMPMDKATTSLTTFDQFENLFEQAPEQACFHLSKDRMVP